MIDYAQARRLMVDGQLRTFDVNDVAVLDAFDAVPREQFAPHGREAFAYSDQPLRYTCADGDERAMPAPMVLARMIQALKVGRGARALDVATGHGYGAALLHRLGAHVTALEPDAALAEIARERLGADADVLSVPFAQGASEKGPFDVVLVEGRIEERPVALLDALQDGGRLVCVFGRARESKATLFLKSGDAIGARPLFDAALPALKAFATAPSFAF